jgi:hypothetical protein
MSPLWRRCALHPAALSERRKKHLDFHPRGLYPRMDGWRNDEQERHQSGNLRVQPHLDGKSPLPLLDLALPGV